MSPPRFPTGALFVLALFASLGAWVMVTASRLEVTSGADRRAAKADRDLAESKDPTLTPAKRKALRAKAVRRLAQVTAARREAQVLEDHHWASALGLAPLLLVILLGFNRQAIAALRAWPARRVAWLAAGISVWFLLWTADGFFTVQRFDAYLPVIAAVVLPLGLATGFLELTAPQITLGQGLLASLGIALTVALPEELFFRGILDSGLRKHFRSPWASLAISSLAFSLMYWNNRGDLNEKLLYVLLATIAGAFYGLAFRKSKGLVAPVLVHTTVDVVWVAFLRG